MPSVTVGIVVLLQVVEQSPVDWMCWLVLLCLRLSESPCRASFRQVDGRFEEEENKGWRGSGGGVCVAVKCILGIMLCRLC